VSNYECTEIKSITSNFCIDVLFYLNLNYTNVLASAILCYTGRSKIDIIYYIMRKLIPPTECDTDRVDMILLFLTQYIWLNVGKISILHLKVIWILKLLKLNFLNLRKMNFSQRLKRGILNLKKVTKKKDMFPS